MDRFFLDNLWRWKCGLPELDEPLKPEPMNTEDLRKSEWSEEFETLMRNRLVMGAFRYGKIGDKNKPVYDRIESIERRARKYRETGNKEFLVDIANLCLLEFVEGEGHFESIDDGEHVNIK